MRVDEEDDRLRGNRNVNDADDSAPKTSDWRYGPAQLWYDLLDVSESDTRFDYGFKLKEVRSSCQSLPMRCIFCQQIRLPPVFIGKLMFMFLS